MPTNKPRITITGDAELFVLIERYRHDNGITSTSAAVYELIKKGLLAEDERLHNGGVYSGDEIRLVSIFRRSDEECRSNILDELLRSVARNRRRSVRDIEDTVLDDVVTLIDLYREADAATRNKVFDILTDNREDLFDRIEDAVEESVVTQNTQ